ncbi:MAG: S8 family serine peptidase [Oscillatoriaceae cyanobacterium Prado104]|nr:S8 family serine peptidase [Oscillatoriaceae cyanobacterium Prado104]
MTDKFSLPDDLKNTLAEDQWWLLNNGQTKIGSKTIRPGTAGIDLNVLPLWPQYAGEGITVSVIDDGVDGEHEDLRDNFDRLRSLPDNLGGPFPGPTDPENPDDADDHGTAVAGIIAGSRNNIGTVGVAYQATIVGYKNKSIGEDSDEEDAADKTVILASLQAQQRFDVSNNSWGPNSAFEQNTQDVAAIRNAVTNGRSGLGTVFVWSGGNERENFNPNLNNNPGQRGRNVNLGDYENSRNVIAVAAIDNQGVVAPYSNPGAPLLVSAFGDRGSIATLDRTGNDGYNPRENQNFQDTNYTNNFNGTSSAAPMVSGIVALMLQANPRLGYRDVQEILAYSARKNDPDNQDVNSQVINRTIFKDIWEFNGAQNWNGGGLHVNHDYGFGLADATAAVRLAETWQLRSGQNQTEAATATNERVQIANLTLPTPIAIPDNNPVGITRSFRIDRPTNIDKIELNLDIDHGQFQDLTVTLTSPDGTESVILDRVPYFTQVGKDREDYGFKGTTINYTFSSARHWGETGVGNWTLNISDNSATNDPINNGDFYTPPQADEEEDAEENGGADEETVKTSGNNTGRLKGATLRLYGDDIINDNTYIYTNEFASFSDDRDPNAVARQTLNDTNDGNDAINVAAIADGVTLNLAPGVASSLPGRDAAGRTRLNPVTLTIAPGSVIENAFAGDGDDSIVGNDAPNTLYGGRGNDTLVAVGDGDTLIGNDPQIPVEDSSGNRIYNYRDRDYLVGGPGNTTFILDPEKSAGSKIINVDRGTTINSSVNSTVNNLILPDITLTNSLAPGQNGIARQGRDLAIDLNADGAIARRDDAIVENFFSPGAGRFQTVGNLSGSQILTNPPANSGKNAITVAIPTPTPAATPTPTLTLTPEGTTPTLTPTPEGTTPTLTPTPTGTNAITTLTPALTLGITFGTANDDIIEGSAENDSIDALGLNDEVFGEGGDDSLEGNTGDDYLDGGPGSDSLIGGAGDDILDDEFGNNLLSGGDGNDEVYGGNDADTIAGEGGNDSLFGDEGDDSIAGGAGSDVADGEAGNDTVTGGEGNDALFGGLDNDSLNGGLGSDELYGDDGNDTLESSGGVDSLFGGAGDDLYLLNATLAGGNIIADGGGNDTLTLNGVTVAIGLASGTAGVTRGGEFNTDLLVDINRNGVFNPAVDLLILDFFADRNLEPGEGFIETVGNLSGDTILASFPLKATSGPDFLSGGSSDDRLEGLPGNDTIDGDAGDDSLFGNTGNDELNGDELIAIAGAGGTVILGTQAGDDFLDGGRGNDTINGGDGSDTLSGNRGNDSLSADSGDDILNGGPGGDSLYGGSGNDTVLGNKGEDRIFGNVGNDSIDAGRGSDIVVLGKGADEVLGGGGNDSLYGNEGFDVILGGKGNDLILGGRGNDSIAGDGGNDSIFGQLGNDLLLGGSGNDIVRGGAGDDSLAGVDPSAPTTGTGEFDTLIGGSGRDRFLLGDGDRVYYDGAGNAVITDFNSVDDTIVLSGTRANYTLSVSGNVTSIFLRRTGQPDNLIATVQGTTNLNLDRPYFIFI